MHSNVLSSKFMTKSQELRLQSILDGSPRFAPWGAGQWDAPEGYAWTSVEHGKVPDTVLVRKSDHAAVLIVPRYTNLVFCNREACAFTCTNDGVPMFYIVRRSQIDQHVTAVHLKDLEGSTYFPCLDRSRIVADMPGLPSILAGHYFLEDNHYVWTLNTKTGEFNHQPLTWFNNSIREVGFESVELIRTDPMTQILIGSGSHIPSFVMNIEGTTLLAFIRRYKDGEVDEPNMHLIERWTERLLMQNGSYIS
ncbi:MAG: hypothetical protein GC165_13155 [Armatimonadetes bacterium]|nr:hypothetical protein [Armatimonadota bacterium]